MNTGVRGLSDEQKSIVRAISAAEGTEAARAHVARLLKLTSKSAIVKAAVDVALFGVAVRS